MININLCNKTLKLFALSVIFIILSLGLHIEERCIAKDFASYQGKAFSLNNKVISDSEFQYYIDCAVADQAKIYRLVGSKATTTEIWDNALTMAIKDLALQQEIDNHGSEIKVSNEEAEALINKYFPTEEELRAYMDSQNFINKKTLLKAVIKELERQKLLLLKAREFKMEVSEAEILENLEQITVSHVMIGFRNDEGKIIRTEAQALARANEVYRKTVTDGDFVTLVKKYSDDSGSRDNGGVYGPMPLSKFKISVIREFVEATLALHEGEISKPIKTQYGYHIIRLDKRKMPKGDDYSAKYKEAEREVLLSKIEDSIEYKIWLTELYEDAEEKVVILDPALLAYRLSMEKKWHEAAANYEKALNLKYYAEKWNVYLDAANVYLKMKQPAMALNVLKKVAVVARNTPEYQEMLKNVNQASNEGSKEKK